MPCHPARARELLTGGKAKVFRLFPFTIILTERKDGDTQPVSFKTDPGSRTTGIAIVAEFGRGRTVIWAAGLNHRGHNIGKSLSDRRAVRRGRRKRKTRYRKPRLLNRRRAEGWLPPSLLSRVGNIRVWLGRILSFVPLTEIEAETVRFDTQKMQNPEISGTEYRQGELSGYEVREYLLEKWGRKCAYCGKENVPLEIEHIIPESKGGSDRVSNLTVACENCNRKKGNRDIGDFLKRKPDVLRKILSGAKAPLRDTAAVNAARYAVGKILKSFGLPVSFWSGGRTKYNRTKQGYPKDHWIDAACVGESGRYVLIPEDMKPLIITAAGRGSRQMCRMDRYGFPSTAAKKSKTVGGFVTGDIVRAVVPKGKKAGTHRGRVAVRLSGSFRVGKTDGISRKYCELLQRSDGYEYKKGDGVSSPASFNLKKCRSLHAVNF